jgi:hypothetical protein
MLKSDPCFIFGWIRGDIPVYIGAAGAVASSAAQGLVYITTGPGGLTLIQWEWDLRTQYYPSADYHYHQKSPAHLVGKAELSGCCLSGGTTEFNHSLHSGGTCSHLCQFLTVLKPLFPK